MSDFLTPWTLRVLGMSGSWAVWLRSAVLASLAENPQSKWARGVEAFRFRILSWCPGGRIPQATQKVGFIQGPDSGLILGKFPGGCRMRIQGLDH